MLFGADSTRHISLLYTQASFAMHEIRERHYALINDQELATSINLHSFTFFFAYKIQRFHNCQNAILLKQFYDLRIFSKENTFFFTLFGLNNYFNSWLFISSVHQRMYMQAVRFNENNSYTLRREKIN